MSAILAFFIKFIGSAAFGSVTGFIGSYIKGKQEITKLKVQNEFELKKLESDREMQKLEIAGATTKAKISADAQRDIADAETLAESYKQDKRSYSEWSDLPSWIKAGLGMMDMLRASVRPVISYASALGLFYLVRYLLVLIPLEILVKEKPEIFWPLFEYVIMGTTFTALATITYWYGTRPYSKK